MKDRIFYAICFGFVVGVLVRSLLEINIFVVLFIGIMAMAMTLFFSLISKVKWGVVFSIFILAFCFGAYRFHASDKPAPYVFESRLGEEANFTGVVIDEPEIRENNVKFKTKIEDSGEKINILITTSFNQDIKYGDKLNIIGKLKKPENFITDQGKDFDYVNYLRKDGIFYLINYPKIELVSNGHGNFIKSFLFEVKEKFLGKVNSNISEPESLLMGGLILGEKASFSDDLRTSFINTGTIHIVALSGYNVTIVAEWIMKLFSYFPRNFGIGMGIFVIILFVLMTGASSTAIRAGIMAILVLVARATGRNYDVARALTLAGVFMILYNPFTLIYDVSFQLSFIATVAVIFYTPKIEKYFSWVPKTFQLRDIVSVTSAAYIFVTPFILYKMGNLSLVALPANILILPFIPITMLFGFLTGFVGLFWYTFSVPFGYISYLLLNYELSVVNFFSNLSFSAFYITNFPLIITLIIYAYFIYILFGRSMKNYFTEPL